MFSFLAACTVLPDTPAECFSLLFVIPRNSHYGTAHLVTQFQRTYFSAIFTSQRCQYCSAKIIKLALVFWLKWVWGMLYIVSFHTDHLLPNAVALIGSCSFLEKQCELAVAWPEEGDRNNTALLDKGWWLSFRLRRSFYYYQQIYCLFETELYFEPQHCTASLFNLQDLFDCSGRTHCKASCFVGI